MLLSELYLKGIILCFVYCSYIKFYIVLSRNNWASIKCKNYNFWLSIAGVMIKKVQKCQKRTKNVTKKRLEPLLFCNFLCVSRFCVISSSRNRRATLIIQTPEKISFLTLNFLKSDDKKVVWFTAKNRENFFITKKLNFRVFKS